MSKKLLMAALTVFTVTAISAGGTAANATMPDSNPIARDHRSAPIAQDLHPGAEHLPGAFGSQSVESPDGHVVKTGVWSSVKNAAKKVGGAVKKAAKAAVKGTSKVVGSVAKVPLDAARKVGKVIGKGAKVIAKGAKEIACKAEQVTKRILPPAKSCSR